MTTSALECAGRAVSSDAPHDFGGRCVNTDDRERLLARFWAKVNKTETCWLWVGAAWTNKRSWLRYGSFNSVRLAEKKAHRAAFVLFRGEIPSGLTIDHLCGNTLCVRPDHLEAVPLRENIMRGDGMAARHAAQETCVNGHDEWRVRISPRGAVWRRCAQCHRDRDTKRRAMARLYATPPPAEKGDR